MGVKFTTAILVSALLFIALFLFQPGISGQLPLGLQRYGSATLASHGRSFRTGPLPGSGQVFFTPPLYPQSGAFSLSVAVGDFNKDGKLDLAVVNQCQDGNCQNGGVTILLGNGDGTFRTGATYPSGGYEAYSIAAGVFSRNGKTDLVIANGCQSPNQCGNGVVGVLLGNGDGTFKPAKTYPSGGLVASSVSVAHLGNHEADLVVANQCLDGTCTGGGVSVLLGNGDGTFGQPTTYPSGGYNAISIATGEFNGDGKQDVAVANQCQSSSDCTGSVGVLLGNGDGTLQNVQTFPSGGFTAYSVVAKDVNNDGRQDLVLANQCLTADSCGTGVAGVLLGNGDGTFQTAQSYPSSGTKSSFVVLGDFNRDSKTDLLVIDQCQGPNACTYGSVSLLLGNGDGTFQPALGYASEGGLAYSAAVADFNGDGNLDAAVVNQCQNSQSCSGLVTIMLGNGDGTFRLPPAYEGGGYNTNAVAVGDLNQDGKADLVVTNFCPTPACGNAQNGLLTVLTGNGDGTFQTGLSYPSTGSGTSSVAVGDLNRDGNLDVAVANQCGSGGCPGGGSVTVLFGNGDGTLHAARDLPSGGFTASSVAIADVNGDGNLDLIVANQCQASDCQSGGNVSVLLGNGDGTFQPAQSYPAVGYDTVSVAVADLNGDGHPDIALASECKDSTCGTGMVSVLLGNGDGTFQPAQTYDSLGVDADSISVADLKANGKLDLVVSNLCQFSTCSVGWITVFLGRGDGTFNGGHHYASGGENAYSVAEADFNGDGILDLVVANNDGTALLPGNGDGTFQTASPYFPGGVFVQDADFNGDGQPDIVVANGFASTVTILLNVVSGYRHTTSTTLTSSPNPSSAYQSVLFTATVSTQYQGPPTGTVTFMDGTTQLGTGTLSNGQATLNYPFPSPGIHKIIAIYSGDSNYAPSSSPPLRQQITKALTTTTLTSAPNPSQQGQVVTFTATVTGEYGGTPTGKIQFKQGGNVLGTVPLSNGVAIYQTSTLPKGKHTVFAFYNGDGSFKHSEGKVVQVVK